MVAGNLRPGTQKSAMRMLSDFRTNLFKRTGEIISIQEARPASTAVA